MGCSSAHEAVLPKSAIHPATYINLVCLPGRNYNYIV